MNAGENQSSFLTMKSSDGFCIRLSGGKNLACIKVSVSGSAEKKLSLNKVVEFGMEFNSIFTFSNLEQLSGLFSSLILV